MSILAARNLSKAYGARALLDGVTFTIREGEKVGLIGSNGAGKSTLLRVVAGAEPADVGTVERRRGARVLFLTQEPVLPAGGTPREIVEGGLLDAEAAITAREEATRAHLADEMMERLGVREPDRPVDAMSGGERRRVALARLLVARPDVAILDEPTNHLDTETIEWLETYLAESFRGAVFLVTHDRYVLDSIADRVLELDRGKLTEFAGGYAEYLEQKAEMLSHEARVEQNRLNVLRRERAWLLRGAKARSTKQKARIQRAEALVAAEAPAARDALSLRGVEDGAQRLGKTILDFEGVSLSLGERVLVRDLTLRLTSGERLGILGPNGAGKTSLLKLASGELGEEIRVGGTVTRGAGTRFAYFDQARALLRDDWSVFDNVAEREGAERTGAGVVTLGARTMEMRTYLEQFLFDGGAQRQKVGALSGGERARVALAKVLKSGANLLLLDEPTNDLDVATLGALEELLETWPGCALVVSHDRYFLNRVATSILAFEEGGQVTRYAGNYDSYRLQRRPPAPAAAEVSAPRREQPSPPPAAAGAKAARKALTYAERIELEGLLDRVAEAEARVSTLESRLADPTLYSQRASEAGAISAELDLAREAVAHLTARWEDLEGRRD